MPTDLFDPFSEDGNNGENSSDSTERRDVVINYEILDDIFDGIYENLAALEEITFVLFQGIMQNNDKYEGRIDVLESKNDAIMEELKKTYQELAEFRNKEK